MKEARSKAGISRQAGLRRMVGAPWFAVECGGTSVNCMAPELREELDLELTVAPEQVTWWRGGAQRMTLRSLGEQAEGRSRRQRLQHDFGAAAARQHRWSEDSGSEASGSDHESSSDGFEKSSGGGHRQQRRAERRHSQQQSSHGSGARLADQASMVEDAWQSHYGLGTNADAAQWQPPGKAGM